MKKSFLLLSTMALLVAFSSCHKIVVEGDVPQQSFVEWTWDEFVDEGINAVALADVFDQYQKVRSNRTEAVELVSNYFSTTYLYYDSMLNETLGKIAVEEDGSYLVSAKHWRGWIGLNINHNLKVTVTGEHRYHIVAVKGNEDSYNYDDQNHGFEDYHYVHEFDAVVDNGRIICSNLNFTYTHPYSQYYVTVSCPEGEFVCNMPKNGKMKYWPSEGTLHFEYKCTGSQNNSPWPGLEDPCRLTVRFHADSIDITDKQGFSLSTSSKPSWYSYFYY